MGYRGVLRSLSASANRAERERIRRENARLREVARLNKRLAAHNAKLDKIAVAIEDVYAKGKITKEEYASLKDRMDDIPLELVIVGKQPFISLAKRYVTGKIDKEEFEEIKTQILPADFIEERGSIEKQLQTILEKMDDFRKSCKDAEKGFCQKCGAKKKLFNWVSEYEGFKLCKKCRSALKGLQVYTSFSGRYFTVDARCFHLNELDSRPTLPINLRDSLL